MKVKAEETTLWESIRKFLYITDTIGLTKLPGEEPVSCCRLEREWLSDVFTEHDFAVLKPWTPIFIASQTGSGKSTLILERCFPVALREKKKILYIASRNSLLSQMKTRAMRDPVNAEQQGDYMRVGDMGKEYSPLMMKRCHNFGIIEIYSYQELIYRAPLMDFERYSFVVLDEAHFFMSDATFNHFTEAILDIILEKCKYIRRIYVTATPDEVFDIIFKKEKDLWPIGGSYLPEMQVYIGDEDYSYLKTTFLNNADELVQAILNSKESDSWLIFVRDKAMGKHLLDSLDQIKEDVLFITAEVDVESKEYHELVEKEKLPRRVLIATKVIDVGVNIKTEGLHVASFEDDPVELKQMIGRKRMKSNETLDLYVVVPSMNELRRRLGLVQKELKTERTLIDTIESEKGNQYYTELPHPLYVNTSDGISYNSLSISKLLIEQNHLKKLIRTFYPLEDEWADYKKLYASTLMSNFPSSRDFLYEIETVKNEIHLRIDELVKRWWGNTLNENERDAFSKELASIVGDVRKDQRTDRGTMKSNAINKALNRYGYVLKSLKTTPVTYELEMLKEGGINDET